MASDLDGPAVAEALDSFIEMTDKPYLQPTAFLLDASGSVVHSIYSSGVVGRLSSSDVAGLVKMHSGR